MFPFKSPCCCQQEFPPDTVNVACSMDSCVLSSTDGTGMEFFGAIDGGTATFSADSIVGRPKPGYKLTSIQTGDADTAARSVILLDEIIPYPLCSIKKLTICGEFLRGSLVSYLRVYPCIVQDDVVFVRQNNADNPYTSVASTSSWTLVSQRVIDPLTGGMSYFVHRSIDDYSYASRRPSGPDTKIGFLVLAKGTDPGENLDVWIDNVCVSVEFFCDDENTIHGHDDLLIECSSDFVTGLSDGDCSLFPSFVNDFLTAGVTVTTTDTYPQKLNDEWYYSDTATVTGGTVDIVVQLTWDPLADGWLLYCAFDYISGGFAAERLRFIIYYGNDLCQFEFDHIELLDDHNCGSPGYSSLCCPSGYADPSDITITPL